MNALVSSFRARPVAALVALALIACAPCALVALALLAIAPAAHAASAPAPARTLDLGRGPTFVIVHDLGDSRLTWMPTARALLAGHRVVLADLPGHGDTPLPDPFSLAAAAEALDGALAQLDPDSTVLVGKGMGGLVAMLEAETHPERMRGLVLVDAALAPPMKVDDQQMKQFFDWVDANYEQFVTMTFGKLGRDSLENVAIRARVAQVAPLTVKSYLRAAMTADAASGLPRLKPPLLVVATGAALRGQDWATAGKLLGWPNPAAVPVRTLPDAGALVMQQQPDSLAAILDGFERQVIAKR